MVTIKVKKLTATAILPEMMSEDAAGADISYNGALGEEVIFLPGSKVLVTTGLSIEVPKGFEAQVRPRSGLSIKKEVIVLNSPGTIDADYRGEVMVGLKNISDNIVTIRAGDRVAQLVIKRVEPTTYIEVPELSDTKRGTGGLGSTGL